MAQLSGALSHEVQAAEAVTEAERVRWWMVLIAVVTLALGCIASMYLEMRTRSVRMAVSNLPMTRCCHLCWLLGNTLLKRFMPRLSLTSAELRLLLCVALDRRTIRRVQLGEPMGGTNGRTEVFGVAREPLGRVDFRSPALVDVPDQRPQSTGGILPGSGAWRKRPLGSLVNAAFLVSLHGTGDYRDWPGADGTVSKTLGAARAPGIPSGGYLPVADRGI